MSVILLLILASLAVAGVFLGAYIWAVRAGQFDDTSTPALRMLAEETARTALPASGLQPPDGRQGREGGRGLPQSRTLPPPHPSEFAGRDHAVVPPAP